MRRPFDKDNRLNAPERGILNQIDLSKRRSIKCHQLILTMATVPAQAVRVCEFGFVQGALTRNLGASIEAKDRAGYATGKWL
jgi:hypothetical protein